MRPASASVGAHALEHRQGIFTLLVDSAGGQPSSERARFVAWHAHHHVAGRVSQYELAALTPGHYAEILQLRRQSTDIFRQAVNRGIDEGTFTAVDVHRVVRAILSLGVDLVRWYRTGGADSPEQLGEFYADLALGMVTSAENNTARREEQAVPASAISRQDPGPV